MFFITNSYILIMDSFIVLLLSDEFDLFNWWYNSKNELSGANLFLFWILSSGDSIVFPVFINESNNLLTKLDKNSI